MIYVLNKVGSLVESAFLSIQGKALMMVVLAKIRF